MNKSIPEVLANGDLDKLLAAPNPRYPTGARNRAMIAVMSDCGLRISEALNLEPRDINMETGQLHVHNGKGNKDRMLWAGDRTLEWIQAWLRVRPEALKLFCTLQGAPIQTAYVRAMMKRYAKRAGIDPAVHPHTLRHTFATDLLMKTKNIVVVKEALGHASLDTTMVYLHITDDVVESAMKDLRRSA